MIRTMLGIVAAIVLFSSGLGMFMFYRDLIIDGPPQVSELNTMLFAATPMVLSAWALAWLDERMKRDRAARAE